MVLSCLVEPLVAPLVGRGAGPRRGSALSRRRLLATALMASALVGVTTQGHAAEVERRLKHGRAEKTEQRALRNAHQKPAAKPYRLVMAEFALAARPKEELAQPGQAADFESDGLRLDRLRHARDIGKATGPTLALARRLDALTAARSSTFLRFGSGHYRSGAPTITII